jgi:hypothetical protein
MKKIYLALFLGILLTLSFVAAAKLIPEIALEDKAGWKVDNVKDFSKSKDSLYGKVSIKNTLLWFLPLGTIEDIELKTNTNTCASSCSAEKEITIYTDTKLIDSVKFLKLDSSTGKWIESNIRSYQFYIRTQHEAVTKYEYHNTCEAGKNKLANGSTEMICSDKLARTYTEYNDTWEPYNYEVMPAGTYYIKLVGEKRADLTYDWIITSQGKEINEWAIWSGYTDNNNKLVWYKLNQGSGTTATDFTGYGRNGNFLSAPTWIPSPISGFGNATSLALNNGLNTSFTMNASDMRNFTLELRYNGSGSAGDFVSGVLFTQGNVGTTGGFGLAFGSGKMASKYGSCGQVNNIGPTQNVGNNSYLVLTKNGTEWKTYLDGVLLNTQTCTLDTAASPVIIGVDAYGYFSPNYKGVIDNVVIWDKVLSASEILSANSSTTDGTTPVITTLNSPVNGYNTSVNSILFNASASVTGGPTISNISFWDNSTGTFKINYTRYFSANVLNFNQIGLYSGIPTNITLNQSTLTGQGYANFYGENSAVNDRSYINLSLPNAMQFNESTSFSFVAWIKPMQLNTTAGHSAGIIGVDQRYALDCSSATTTYCNLRFGFRNASGIVGNIATQAPLYQWGLAVATYDGATKNMSLYYNGTVKYSLTNTVINVNLVTKTFLPIGHRNSALGGTNHFFNGSMDDVMIYNKTLSASEVSNMWNSYTLGGIGGSPIRNAEPSTNGLVAFYSFDQELSSPTSASAVFNQTYLDGNYNWTASACDTDSFCGLATVNRTFTVDTVNPVVDITYPSGTLTSLANGTVIPVNYTLIETNKDTCWKDYNGVNTTISGCLNTSINYINGVNSVRIWANDTVGHIAGDVAYFNYSFFENGRTFQNPIAEYAPNTISLNITFPVPYLPISANLIYDNTTYSSALSNIDSNSIFSNTLYVSAGTKNFYWNITYEDGSSNRYSYVTSNSTQTINPSTALLCNATNNVTFVRFTTKSIDTKLPVNSTFKTTWSYGPDQNNTANRKNLNYSDTNGNKSVYEFCLSPVSSTFYATVTIEYDAPEYAQNYYYIYNGELTNQTQNITLYLLNESLTTLTTFQTIDRATFPVTDIIAYVQQYDVGTDTYYTVSMLKTDWDGKDISFLYWYDYLYKIVFYQNGTFLEQTTPFKISSTPLIFRVLDAQEVGYEKFKDISYNLIYNNITQNIVLTFTKDSGLVTSGCLRVFKMTATNQSTICDQCETSNSATIYCNVASAGNGTFIGQFYALGSWANIDTQEWTIGTAQTLYNLLGNDLSMFYAFIAGGIVFVFFLISPVLGIIGIILALILNIAMGFFVMDLLTFTIWVIAGGIIIWIIKR